MNGSRPSERSFPFDGVAIATELSSAWRYSRERISGFRECLVDAELPEYVLTVAVSGSLCRMEAHPNSDVDVLVVVDDESYDVASEAVTTAYDQVWGALAACDPTIHAPESRGIFSHCVYVTAILDKSARGIINEDLTTYGQRMQLIIDAQPLYKNAAFEHLQRRILDWYTEERVACLFGEAGPFHWLVEEIHRYWRSIRARACWLYADQPEKSLAVNLKLRSSRLAIVQAMLHAIDISHRVKERPASTLIQQLHFTPLERLASAMPRSLTDSLLKSYSDVYAFVVRTSGSADEIPEDVLAAIRVLREATDEVRAG